MKVFLGHAFAKKKKRRQDFDAMVFIVFFRISLGKLTKKPPAKNASAYIHRIY